MTGTAHRIAGLAGATTHEVRVTASNADGDVSDASTGATAGTGGGGGANATGVHRPGGTGGSGLVIVRYSVPDPA